MEITITGVHYHVTDTTKEFIEKKSQRVEFARSFVRQRNMTITKESHGYSVEIKSHIDGKNDIVVSADAHELYPAIEQVFDKYEGKLRKVKDKLQEHHGKHADTLEGHYQD